MSTQLLREKIANRLRRQFEASLNDLVKQQLRDAKWIAARETTLAETTFAKIDKILAKAKAQTTIEVAPEQEEAA